MNNIIMIMFILCSATSGAFIAHTGNKTTLIIQINDVNLRVRIQNFNAK